MALNLTVCWICHPLLDPAEDKVDYVLYVSSDTWGLCVINVNLWFYKVWILTHFDNKMPLLQFLESCQQPETTKAITIICL